VADPRNPASADLAMPEFTETKRLLDEINAAISGYDPILKEHARDILLKTIFGWETHRSDDPRNRSEMPSERSESQMRPRALTVKDYAEKWIPRTGSDRALLGLYYLKKALGLRSATGRQISKELKENGMEVANISVAMHENVRLRRAESRVIRGQKGTKQARNDYAITDIGIQYVESRFELDLAGSRLDALQLGIVTTS